MPIDLMNRAKNAWNAFVNNKDPTEDNKDYSVGYEYSYRPDRLRYTRGSERSIVNAVYTRIAIDVASVDIRHVRLDENDRYEETIDSDLNECLSTEANIDQTGRSLIQDIVMSMFDEGVVAVIPIDTDRDPNTKAINEIYSMRTAKIVGWKPKSVRVRAYDDKTGQYKEIEMLKENTLIIENPLYAVINEPNSTVQRLIRKLSLLDTVDEQSGSGKLDLIIQLPYTVKSELRQKQAAERKKAIEDQLVNSKYGIAYIDSTEHITQLNRAVENNLMSQIEYLTNMFYSQLGITVEIMNGTADEKTMINYNNRTIEPILSTITGEMKRKWLTKTARTQKQSIMFFRDPFRLVPVSNLAEIADKFTRNEIMTSNEVRQIIGMKKSDDPNADQLRNKNLNQSTAEVIENPEGADINGEMSEEEIDPQAETQSDYDEAVKDLDDLDKKIDDLEDSIEHDGLSYDEWLGIANSTNFDDWLQHYASPYYDPVAAHEYYMKHRKLVGRKSTAGLNDEGKERAAYVKNKLDTERSERVTASTSSMNSKIASSQARTESNVKKLNEKKASDIEKSREAMQKKIDHFRYFVSDIKSSHTENTNAQIKKLSSELSGKTDVQKDKIREKIAKLRADNAKKRDELTQSFNNLSSKERSAHAANSESAREETSKSVANAREEHKTNASKLRSENKQTTSDLKDEYDKKYEDELEYLKNSDQFKKESKSKSSSESAKKLYKFKNHPNT